MKGLIIRYQHWRINPYGSLQRYYKKESLWTPLPRGGRTVCTIRNQEGVVLATGKAECSVRDAFCYRLGRNISRGRALKDVASPAMPLGEYAQALGVTAHAI